MSSFQSSSVAQGRQFAQQCDSLLGGYGYTLEGSRKVPGIGVEVDQIARSPGGTKVWFEYKGSIQGTRPGLLRTDTLKKAVANGALIAGLEDHPPYIVLTSHLPTGGAGQEMLETANRLGYFADVVCIYDPKDQLRLKEL
ncbi:MAG TPA: hypothetical protein VFF40_13470 [Acidimicrobiia bacterium]|nr:hypothetical protein [Acidimicrobiia bacterium]